MAEGEGEDNVSPWLQEPSGGDDRMNVAPTGYGTRDGERDGLGVHVV